MKINMFEGARRIVKLIAVIWVVGVCIYEFNSKPYIHAYFLIDSPNNVPIRMGEQENNCDEDDAREYLYAQRTSKGTDVSLTLCFKSKIFDDGRKLIPYQVGSTAQLPPGFVLDNQSHEAITKNDSKKLKPFDPDAYLAAKGEAITQKDKKKTGGFDLSTARPVEAKVWGNEKYSSEVLNYTKSVARSFKLIKADEEWADSKVWPARWGTFKEGVIAILGGLAFLWIFSWGVGWIVRGFGGIPSRLDRKLDDK